MVKYPVRILLMVRVLRIDIMLARMVFAPLELMNSMTLCLNWSALFEAPKMENSGAFLTKASTLPTPTRIGNAKYPWWRFRLPVLAALMLLILSMRPERYLDLSAAEELISGFIE
jgi:hypothetical protein